MINEEIDKIKYLFKYKKGVVISEQEVPPPPADAGAIPPPPPATSGETAPTTGSTTGDTTTQTTTVPQKVDPDKLRDCAGFKSGGKLTKGEEKGDYIIFNNEKGIPVCKKPKQTP